MKHIGTQTIETDRLILRKFNETDYIKAFEHWLNDERVNQFMRWSLIHSLEEAKILVNTWIKEYQDLSNYKWAITLKDSKELIGVVGAMINDDLQSANLGYCLSPLFWNQGIMSEVLKAIFDFFFNQVNCNIITARHDSRNINSGKVMQKAGMKYEGTLRQSEINNSGICDSVHYSILKEEYFLKS